ncbi:hypothetical protein GCM10009125_27960 [Castellaniella daejeonensis]|uniref:Uncharacterized protein n=1 Tax=Castellaniella daejeonensis TaxID=659013 RepID=A0ABN0U3G6_9BURK
MTTETVLTDADIHDKYQRITGYRSTPPVVLDFARAIEQAVLQSPEIQALRKDAERYRHLRDEVGLCPYDLFNAWWLSDHGNPQTIDEAIDISMEQKP